MFGARAEDFVVDVHGVGSCDIVRGLPVFSSADKPDFAWKLLKSLYGLKQANCRWHLKVYEFMVGHLDYESSPYHPCQYVLRKGVLLVIVVVYLDHLLLACINMSEIMQLEEQFNQRFEIKDLEEARMCLGLEIRRNRESHTLHLGQAKYAAKVLERYGMHESRPVATPMECQRSAQDVNGDRFDATLYRQAIGSLMYLMVGTRPDISYALGQLSQYVQCPTEALWNGVKRVLRYVNGTRELGILFDGTTDLWPVGFCDSDWAGDQVDRKSTSGYVFVVGSGAVS